MMQNWRIAISLLAVFASGVLVGGFSHRVYSVKAVEKDQPRPKSPDDYRKRYVEELRTRLHLEAAQLEQLNGILDETRKQFHAAQATIRPEMKRIQDYQVERIRAILTDTQKPEYEKIRQEREKRMRESKRSEPSKTEQTKP